MSTIYDVAHEARVSIATVSYVINNKNRVSPETAERVREAMRRLNYQPKNAARALARGRTNTIALVAPLDIYGYQMSLITVMNAIGHTLATTDYRLFIHPTLNRPEAWMELEADVLGKQMDGVILMHVQMQDPRVELLRRSKMPFVMIGRCADNTGLYYVDTDIEATARLAVEYLYGLGHRRIALLGERREAGVAVRLVTGYRQGMEHCGLEIREDFIVHVAGTPAATSQAAIALFSLPDRPSAIFATSDAAVLGVMNATRILGLRIPQDIAIIGYAESPLYPFLEPPCSVAFEGVADLGRLAAEMLVSLLHGQEPAQPQILVPPRLIVRASTEA